MLHGVDGAGERRIGPNAAPGGDEAVRKRQGKESEAGLMRLTGAGEASTSLPKGP